MNVKQIAILE